MDSTKLLKRYPVMQLKKMLRTFNQKKKLGIKAISKVRKPDVINYLLYHKYNLNDLPEIEKQQTSGANYVLKKSGVKTYNDEEQEQFLNNGY
jgi:hypothetical protein